MQNNVKIFNKNRTCHKKQMPTFARILNIQSEMGELAKSYLKNSKYGTKDFTLNDEFKEEFGDVLYTILSLANELNLDCNTCLDFTLNKLKTRMENNGSMENKK